ncbi:MAG: Gfo/Idh/MocA family oxidoreductase [Candidatus Latescibacteria bacterium]|nr:Gfo/Idh/MocA family oxidoreductase [Candidatus Latescibacterota bacterium]
MNVAVIGLGAGRGHLRGYSESQDARVLAIADIDERRLASNAEQFHIPQVYKDYKEMLKVPEIEAVSVCLPNDLHASVSIDVLNAGKHVLVEKPMARSAAEAEAMVAAAAVNRKTVAVSMNYRWAFGLEPHYLKHLITQGTLGSIYYVKTISLRRYTFPRGYTTWFSVKARSGGGGLIDMGPHMLDLAMWLAGDFSPIQVSGVTRTAIMTDTDVDDLASGLIRMKGGATILMESTWATFTRSAMSVTVFGTQGGAILDLNAPQGQRLTLFSEDGSARFETTPMDIRLSEQPDASVQEHFVRSIRAGRQPENAGECGLAVMRVIDAIYQSSATGRDVVIEGE